MKSALSVAVSRSEITAMTLTLTELQRVTGELNERALGGFVQKIRQPSVRAVMLQVRVPGETHHIYLCADAGLARVHLLALPPPNPPAPPQFCMVLRKHLLGGAIRSVELVSGDRIVKFGIEGKDKNGAPTRRSLVLELVPGFENIILIDENDTIIAAVQHAESKEGRRIAPHERYIPPPAIQPGAAAGEDRFEEPLRAQKLATYSAAIERAYAAQDESARSEELRRQLATALSKREKRAKRRLGKIEKDFEATGQSDTLRLKGELLKANLHLVRRGQASVELEDTITQSGEIITVALDAARSPQDNMQRMFKRARKLKAGRAIIKGRLADARAEVAELSELKSELEIAGSLDALQKLREKMPKGAAIGRKRRPEEVRSKPRQFISADGQTILVGRSPRQNDELTRSALGNDMWLHVQQYTGSHVIIKMPKGKPLLKETLLDAAHLAMHFSKLRDADRAPIDYTFRKYVKKPRNAVPGYVTFSQQKTIMLVPDKKRLARLLSGKRE